jgi:hypothetical protein
MDRSKFSSCWLLLLLVAFPANLPSSLPAPSQPPVPTAEERALVSQLARWVAPDAPSSHVVLERGWGRTIRQEPASFELFTAFHDVPTRQAMLTGLPFGSAIATAASRHGVDPLLVAAVVEAESQFHPQLVSPRGAVGLMQIMPSTVGVGETELADPAVNLDRGSAYLAGLLGRFGGDLELSLAAYNAGPNRVSRYGGVPPYDETRHFVDRVLATYVRYQQELWQLSGSLALFTGSLGELQPAVRSPATNS